ncbi:hypothetical protein DY052_07620 [Apilactobacillus timberlakei]|uniref:hypothetical protein n=1 Tax=Apilactobacillus timberlakei TaxID=2008380 RepID=UPI00112D5BBC|nr:hypothetical protein [Apilactobacillus timberlakei]TPR13722.1 hypothetical protein DY052_07620 [Apilactobacillus timberlakei]
MARIQTLNLKNHSEPEQMTLREDMLVFAKLARWNNQDSKGNEIISVEMVQQWLRTIITIDLGLNYDDNIVLNYDLHHNFQLDLSQTLYKEDEKSNIYYIFYGINEFKPYYQNSNGEPVNVAGDRFSLSYLFDGIGSYWLGKSNSFLGNVLRKVEFEDEKTFDNSFHLLSLFYLSINGYKNYQDAEKSGFNANNAS